MYMYVYMYNYYKACKTYIYIFNKGTKRSILHWDFFLSTQCILEGIPFSLEI